MLRAKRFERGDVEYGPAIPQSDGSVSCDTVTYVWDQECDNHARK